MARRIKKLTPEQQAVLPIFRDEWLRWGTCCEPADRPRAEAAILKMRAAAGVTKKPIFVWCQSPATVAISAHVIQGGLGASLRASLRANLGFSLEASLRVSLRASLRASLRFSLEASLGTSLVDSLRDSLGDSPGFSLEASLRYNLGAFFWGQHDGFWIAFYIFCRDIGVHYDPEQSLILDMWRDVAQSCGWWQCYENYVLISERPNICRLDDRNVLHCQDGPSLAFADGWSVYSWHGTRIPSDWIENKSSLTPQIAVGQKNVEQRRAACEILGWENVISGLDAKVIDRDDDPMIGELIEVALPESGPERFIKVQCGTGRTFAIPVPPTVQTALEGNAWSYDLPTDVLKLKEART